MMVVESTPGSGPALTAAARVGPLRNPAKDEGEDGRQAHLNGQIPAALGGVADDLLSTAPDIKTVDVIAVK